jgi:tryptophan-rich sensory protein
MTESYVTLIQSHVKGKRTGVATSLLYKVYIVQLFLSITYMHLLSLTRAFDAAFLALGLTFFLGPALYFWNTRQTSYATRPPIHA